MGDDTSDHPATVLVNAEQVIGEVDRRIYGQFIEHLGRCIYGGIWVGEDSKIENVAGFRKDVLEAVKAIRPPIIRYPGGNFASGYHWLDGVGDRRQRPVKYDLAWGAEEPNQFGTDEFIRWCRLLEAEPFMVANAGNGTPEEAAAWVEYCNGKGRTKNAALRRSNGNQEPHDVKLWGIGNELYGEWQVGYCLDGKECGRRTIDFANEMRKVDPSIGIVGAGSYIDLNNLNAEWNIDLVRTAGKYLDYLSIHNYVSGKLSDLDLLTAPTQLERNLRTTYEMVASISRKHHGGRDIKLTFDEWNVWYPEAKTPLHDQVTSVRDGLFTALVLNALLRLAKQVPIACFAQTVNVLPLISTRDDGSMYVNPQYLAFKMYAGSTGKRSLQAAVQSPCYHSKELNEDLTILDASATIGEETLHVYVVNKDAKRPIECTIKVSGFMPRSIRQQCMSGDGMEDRNSFDSPNQVGIVERPPEKAERSSMVVELPPHSVNILTLR